jgi:peptidoglycan/xylan/chitin deacetylase (PgdA/CDA1 family)
MIDTTWRGKIRWSWIKNADDLSALLRKRYPQFVFSDVDDLHGLVPVFTFHSVGPDDFEDCCSYLSDGGYRTITADELNDGISGRWTIPERAVMLTFDDAPGSVWTVAYPLLKRYGLCATTFAIPATIPDDPASYPNLENVWAGEAALEEILGREYGPVPTCTWSELREMQNSGIVHVESHTRFHALIHIGPTIRDFINPALDPYRIGHLSLPMVSVSGKDEVDRQVILGRPIYEARPRMEGRKRYFDDEGLREKCEAYVAERGGRAFFERRFWRRELLSVAGEYRKKFGDRGRYESAEERHAALIEELGSAREILEGQLGKPVRHLCYPWHLGSETAVQLSKHTGYLTNFWGVLAARNEIRVGTNPYYLPRIGPQYFHRLPGPRRRALRDVLKEHFVDSRSRSR